MATFLKHVTWLLLIATVSSGRKVMVLDDNEWDSVVVTTSPVKITNSRFNPKNSTKDHAIRFNQNSVRSRSAKECATDNLKCLYDKKLQEHNNKNHQDTVNKFLERYASLTNVKINQDFRNGTMKSYWNQINAEKHNHPFDDAKGWVTLDPIPWSSSQVAKWKPNVEPEPPSWFQSLHGQSQPPWIESNHVNDRPFPPRPNVPDLGVQHSPLPSAQWGIGSNDIITDNKPSGFPLNDFPQPTQSGRPPSQQVSSPYGYNPPAHDYQPHVLVPQPSVNHPAPSSQSSPNTFSWQSGYNKFPIGSQSRPTAVSSNQALQLPNRFPVGHPNSYPSEGNGEWVLLSTTKGYSIPQRYHNRRLHIQDTLNEIAGKKPEIVSRSYKSKYQEKELEEVTQSSIQSTIESSEGLQVDGMNILRTAKSPRSNARAFEGDNEVGQEPVKTFKRTMRLTVLPATTNTSSTTSHDGQLEVDSNSQSVDEVQQTEEKLKKLQNMAVVTTGRQQPYQIIPVVNGEESHELHKKRAAVLAAVGAGMIPAAMAVLLPVTLGRKRRSLSDFEKNKQRYMTTLPVGLTDPR